jgi:PGF-pre-PGF domain-containing protein
MKAKISFVFCMSLLILIAAVSAISAADSPKKLSIELEQKMQSMDSHDSSDVIVILKEPKKGLGIQNEPEKKASFKASQEDVISSENINPKILRRFSLVNSFSASLSKSEIEKLEKNENVEKIYYPKSFSVALQDSAPQINADDVWTKQINSVNITGSNEAICILDTGINANHPAFSGRIIAQHCYESLAPRCPNNQTEDTNASDDNGHGTHVAGIAAASGVINGVARGANIVAIKMMNSAGSGDELDLDEGLEWCINNASIYNITAISMSLGTKYTFSDYCDDSGLTNALINQAIAKNITVLVAAGNNATVLNQVAWPACIQNVTAVGGVDKNNNIFSTFSRWNKTNFILAPGVDINSTCGSGSCSGGYTTMQGTSMATPHVAGAVALLQQYSKLKNNRTLTAREVFNALKNTGVNVSDSTNNFSRIDVLAAVRSLYFYSVINQTNENSLIQTNESLSINFTNLNLTADFSAEKISNKNLWVINSNLSSGSFNATLKFYYNTSFTQGSGFFSNGSFLIIRWANSTSSGQLGTAINQTEYSATVQTDHFTDFSLDSLVKANGTNIASAFTRCNETIGILRLNISNKAQDDNITQIIVRSKNSNDSDVTLVLLCSDDGNSNFNLSADCNSTLKFNETAFSQGNSSNATFTNIIAVANNTEKILYIAYNLSSCQNNDLLDSFIPISGITMQFAGASLDSIDPAGNATADFSAPYYTSINYSNYTYSANYLFYSTWLDNLQIDTVWLEINQSNNFTASSQSSMYTANATNLAAGNYSYRWWANDSVNNINQTSWIALVISKANSSVNLTLNGADSDTIIDIGNTVNKTAALLTPSSGYIELYENSTSILNGTSLISNTSNYTLTGYFNITAVYPETQNYSRSSKTHFITVQETTIPPISYKIAPQSNSNSSNRTQIFQINSTDSALKNATLYLWNSSNSAIHNNATNLSGTFAQTNWAYNFTSDGNYTWNAFACDTSSNCNWTSNGNWSLVIDTVKPTLAFYMSSSSITTAQSVNIQCNATDSNLDIIRIKIDGSTQNTTTSSSSCTFTYSPSSSGSYNVSCTADDKAGNSNSTSQTLSVSAVQQTTTGSTGPSGGSPTVTQPTPIPQLPQITESKTITVIAAGTSQSLSINKITTLTNIEISAKNTISNAELTVTKVSSKSSEIPNPPNQVYSYVEITTDISDSDISNATITFEVEKSWLQNADRNSVTLQRYHSSWQSLSTKFINESGSSYTYSAVSPGFSLFAITAKKMEFSIAGTCGDGTCTGNETRTNCCKDCGCEGNKTCANNKCVGEIEKNASFVLWFLVAVAVVAIIRIIMSILPKIKGKLKQRRLGPKKR